MKHNISLYYLRDFCLTSAMDYYMEEQDRICYTSRIHMYNLMVSVTKLLGTTCFIV